MKNTKGVLAIILLTALFASIGIYARILEHSFAIFQQTYLRMIAALLFGFLFFFKDLKWNKLLKIPKKDWVVMIVRAFSYYIGGVILFSIAVFNTTLANVALIQALPFVAVFGVIFFQERLTKGKVTFLLLSLIGIAVISITNVSDIFIWGKGQTLSLIASVCFSFSYISTKWQSNYLNNKEITQIVLFLAVIFLVLGSVVSQEGLPIHGWNLSILGAVLLSGFYNVAILFLVNYGFKYVKPLLASNLLTLEAFFAIIFGFLFYKEFPTMQEIVGGFIIIISAIGMNYLEEKK